MLFDKLQAIRTRVNRSLFAGVAAKVRETAPLRYQPDPRLAVVSMAGHDTVDMYLLAIKSFMVQFVDASIEAIDDGSLTAADKDLLRHHIPGIAISDAKAVDTGKCPSYSSWRRLFRIIERSQSSYVVQLDSDTITAGPMAEVQALAASNTGFMIGDGHWTHPVDPSHMQSMARRWSADGPQAYMERVLTELQHFRPGQRYLHGCAGFAGYPQGSLSRESVEALSLRIESLVGPENWHRWGSEQAMTNCLISATPSAMTLPWPKYRNYMFPATNDPFTAACFIHFIGSHRFADSTYRQAARAFYEFYGELIAPSSRPDRT